RSQMLYPLSYGRFQGGYIYANRACNASILKGLYIFLLLLILLLDSPVKVSDSPGMGFIKVKQRFS
ncbi:MAG TPA: hypothetical protein VIG74_02625, partial [Alphaproteobacteria bacterium]